MKVLFVSNLNYILPYQLIDELKKTPGATYEILGVSEGRLLKNPDLQSFRPVPISENRIKKNLLLLLNSLKSVFILLCMSRPDIINIHYINPCYCLFIPLFRIKSAVLISSVYGSDFYLLGRMTQRMQSFIYRSCHHITFSNQQMAQDFSDMFPEFRKKVTHCRFGLGNLANIDALAGEKKVARQLLGLPGEKLIVSCGHSANIRERQAEMIRHLSRLPDEIKQKILLVFPFTYNAIPDFVDSIRHALRKCTISHIILTEYFSEKQIASYRVACDLLISVPSSDQMTNSMLETLYAGGVVLTGDWLPYDFLDQKKISYLKISSLEELALRVEDIVRKLVVEEPVIDASLNRQIIGDHFSWKSCRNDWLTLFSALEKN